MLVWLGALVLGVVVLTALQVAAYYYLIRDDGHAAARGGRGRPVGDADADRDRDWDVDLDLGRRSDEAAGEHRHCPDCGAPNGADTVYTFCRNCGAEL